MADTPNTTSAPDPTELDVVRTKLNATESELNNYKLRLADFENARKRLLRDAEVERKYATESLARDLIAVLDNLDRALTAAKTAGETGPLASGVSATASQFLDILRRHGVKKIECTPGTTFDPNLHQAVMEQPSEEFKPGQIVQVLEQGFLLHDRVLRAASVIVAAPPS
jgi:molecular chaperone GrpE